jgi:hypothetical protein
LVLPLAPASAQHFTDCLSQTETGSSATVVIENDVETTLPNGASLKEGDEIALITSDGACAGVTQWDSDDTAVSTAVAGPQSGSIPDGESGYALDEELKYTICDTSEDAVYNISSTAEYAPCNDNFLCRADGRYENDVVFTDTSLGSESVLPIELSQFTATVDGTTAQLRWTTLSETNNAGFSVQHNPPTASEWTNQGFVDGQGTTTESHKYQFTLSSLEAGRHKFRLRQIDADGSETLSKTISAVVDMGAAFELSEVTPNPIQTRGRLVLRLRTAQHVTISVFNTLGQRVKKLHDASLSAQTSHVFPLSASVLPSGAYFVRVEGETFSATRRAVVTR